MYPALWLSILCVHSSAGEVESPWAKFAAAWSQNLTALSLISRALRNRQHVVIEPFFNADFAESIHQSLTDPPPVRTDNIHSKCKHGCGPGHDVYQNHVRKALSRVNDLLKAEQGEVGLASNLCEEALALKQWPFHDEDYVELEQAHPSCSQRSESCFNADHINGFTFACSQNHRSLASDVIQGFFPLFQQLSERPLAMSEVDVQSNQFYEGDFFSLHTDHPPFHGRNRAVAVTVHMTKNYGEHDGGEFLWCGHRSPSEKLTASSLWPDARLVRPGFNRAILFVVDRNSSHHAVMPVKPGAQALRQSLQWWYLHPANHHEMTLSYSGIARTSAHVLTTFVQ
eukprot:gnl/TRDRNA2_/TRDRNA2_38696_c0_seq1.p1 gnl/TRDRNA2_/TRDRNA2_38696_c0~~gnl/TRDRNA2_/TRDRNA2_38696_c0_seq1.p1  ORF type:complete len:341 (+),score=16.36 gnl/TRDRNA2_/TRDRNA2_38696_c0_seq1:33-1055(+)